MLFFNFISTGLKNSIKYLNPGMAKRRSSFKKRFVNGGHCSNFLNGFLAVRPTALTVHFNASFLAAFQEVLAGGTPSVPVKSLRFLVGRGVRLWEKQKCDLDQQEPLISILLSFVRSKPFLDCKSSENSQKARGF